ncbi:hypothetical protein [Myroides sp. N17-2]|uniref:hypothetical protein n=1 Tax=Myroides sp. N17-2 TaxID=2030799 RepID=UPI00117C9AE8|nr:hypothetical protein [Myroides sp. N17-2]
MQKKGILYSLILPTIIAVLFILIAYVTISKVSRTDFSTIQIRQDKFITFMTKEDALLLNKMLYQLDLGERGPDIVECTISGIPYDSTPEGAIYSQEVYALLLKSEDKSKTDVYDMLVVVWDIGNQKVIASSLEKSVLKTDIIEVENTSIQITPKNKAGDTTPLSFVLDYTFKEFKDDYVLSRSKHSFVYLVDTDKVNRVLILPDELIEFTEHSTECAYYKLSIITDIKYSPSASSKYSDITVSRKLTRLESTLDMIYYGKGTTALYEDNTRTKEIMINSNYQSNFNCKECPTTAVTHTTKYTYIDGKYTSDDAQSWNRLLEENKETKCNLNEGVDVIIAQLKLDRKDVYMDLFESYLNFKKKDETLYVIPVRTHITSVPNSRPHDIFYMVLYDKENANIIDYTVIRPAFSLANASDKVLDRVVIKSLKEEDVTDSDKVFMMRFFYFSAKGMVPNTYDVFETAYAYNEQSKLAQYLPFKLLAQRRYEKQDSGNFSVLTKKISSMEFEDNSVIYNYYDEREEYDKTDEFVRSMGDQKYYNDTIKFSKR